MTLRNHWKKSVFFSGVAVYGLHRANVKYKEDLVMEKFCKEAVK